MTLDQQVRSTGLTTPPASYQRLGPGVEFKITARTTAAPAGNKIDVSALLAAVKL